MPYRTRVSVFDDVLMRDLRDRLARELAHPDENAAEPVIIEEGNAGAGEPTRLYLIWSDWTQLDQRMRSRVILDAYESVHGHLRALMVTVAMGLTPPEAQQMGIRYA